jgi:hypothetical protein
MDMMHEGNVQGYDRKRKGFNDDTFVYPPKQLAWIDFTTPSIFMYLVVVGSELGNVGVNEIIFISLALIFLLVPRC